MAPGWMASRARRSVGIVLALMLLLPSTSSRMQAQTMVSVQGQARSPAGQSLAGIVIEIVAADGRRRQITLDAAGRFYIPEIEEGSYRLALVRPSLESSNLGDVRLAPDGRGSLTALGITIDYTATPAALPPPPPPPPPPAAPVYNALFDGALNPRPLRLEPGRTVTIRFFIGEPNADSSLTAEKWTVNPAVLNAPGRLELTVQLYCEVCSENRFQKDAITYDGGQRRSTEARFVVVPNADLVTTGVGRFVFGVSSRGREVDNITVEATLGSDTAPPVVAVQRPYEPPPADGPDVDLTITAEGIGDRISFTFEPFDPRLRNAVGRRHLLPDGRFKSFSSGRNASNAAAAIVSDVYTRLRAVASGFEDKLRVALTRSATGVPRITDLDKMPEKDAVQLLEYMVTRTRTLYGTTLLSDSALAEMFDIIEKTNLRRPMRIVIVQTGLAFPWQLLHPPGPLDPGSVWGFKYELTVVPTASRPGRIAARPPAPARLVFGLYGDEKADEDVYRLGRLGRAAYEKETARKTVLADSGASLIKIFTHERHDVGAFVTYTHAQSGLPASGSSPAQTAAGPRIEFGPKDYVSADDLNDTVSRIFGPHEYRTQFFLQQRPFVLLNACETGVASVSGATADGFPEVFLFLGARGVVATEGPVPVYFGYFFGRELLADVRSGTPFPAAVSALRLKMWKQHNPMGLLYAYYGSPFASGI
jgi:hypothetical protein